MVIPRISKGRSATGGLRYDHGPGRREEHERPHRVAGNVPGATWQQRAARIDEHTRTARETAVAKPIHRTSLRLAPEDRPLTDREWRVAAESYVERMGFKDCPWEATRHADDHIHVTVSRVQWDGSLATDKQDFARAQTAARHMEREHNLTDASRRFNAERPQVSHGERESAARRDVRPEREQLRDLLTRAEKESGGTRAGYEEALTRNGVHHRVSQASTGRVSGYSYSLEGHQDEEGKPVWFKGSQVSREHSWGKTQARLDQVREQGGSMPTQQRLEEQEPARVVSIEHPRGASAEEREAAETAIQMHNEHLASERAAAARRDREARAPHERTEQDQQRAEAREDASHVAQQRSEVEAGRDDESESRPRPSAADRVAAANTQSRGDERPVVAQEQQLHEPRHPQESRGNMQETAQAGATRATEERSSESKAGPSERLSAAQRVAAAREASERGRDEQERDR